LKNPQSPLVVTFGSVLKKPKLPAAQASQSIKNLAQYDNITQR